MVFKQTPTYEALLITWQVDYRYWFQVVSTTDSVFGAFGNYEAYRNSNQFTRWLLDMFLIHF